MNAYDWVAIAVVTGLMIRGWRRGFVREVIEVAILAMGALLVFRVSAPVGTVLAAMGNVPYEAARIVATVVLLVALVVAGAISSKVIVVSLKIVPGASVLNRACGSALGFVYGAVFIVLATTLVGIMPLPTGVARDIDHAIGESDIGSEIIDPHGGIQHTVRSVSGESLFGSVLAIRQIVGDRLAAGTIPVPLPSVDPTELSSMPENAEAIFSGLNGYRVVDGREPLSWSGDLAGVAESRAVRAYRSGELRLDGRLGPDMAGAGIPGTVHSEAIVLGATNDGLVEAFTTVSQYAALLTSGDYRRCGVAVVEGPYGSIAVFVLSA